MMKMIKALLFTLFLLLPANLTAVMIVEGADVECRIIDGVRYQNDNSLSLDIEILQNPDQHSSSLFKPRRRFNVSVTASESFKIGQRFTASLKGIIDDLGSGRITVVIIPTSVKILSDQSRLEDIPLSFWESFFPVLPVLKWLFILLGWQLTFLLCFRHKNPLQ